MWDQILDLAAGGRCAGCGVPGRMLCRSCRGVLEAGTPFVTMPVPAPPGIVPAVAATTYDGAARALILAHKERQAFGLALPLGELLARAVTVALTGWPAGSRAVLVPVPSRAATVRARGHDPLRRIVSVAARSLERDTGRVIVLPLLGQRRRIADQRGLGAAERAGNLAGAFAVRERALRRLRAGPAPGAAIVCDDVLTTGATAREAQRALEEAGVPVAAIAVVSATERRDVRLPLAGSLPLSRGCR